MMSQFIVLFLLFSGLASLTYQISWVRLLGLSMGSTSAAVSTVLAAFFLGLALGSYFAERITRNRINDLRVYIVLELVIGVFGLLLLPILLNLDSVMAQLPAYGSTLSAKFIIALLLLIIPTICMGATFPVVASIAIRKRSDVGTGLSSLYAINTAGAVLGAGLTGFLFIPTVGLDGAIYIAFAVNISIAVAAWVINRNLRLEPLEISEAPAEVTRTAGPSPYTRTVALLVLFATGFAAIATEVGWTKYLAIFAGTTIYGFSAILSIFLLGIAGGAWWIRPRMASIRAPHLWLATGLVLLGVALLITRAGLSIVPNTYAAFNFLDAPAWVVFGAKYLAIFFLLILPTFIFGAIFPLNLQIYCGDLQGVRSRVGRAYAVNTVASIFGALLAGFWIIPYFGTDVLLTACALLLLALPLLFIPAVPVGAGRRGATVIALLALGAVGLNWLVPHIDYRDLISSVGYRYDNDVRAGRKPEFIFLKEGKAGVISVVSYDGRLAKLQNNGLNESVLSLNDPSWGRLVEQYLGLVPYFLHDQPRTAFVVGFGGGITTRALTYTDLESIRVVELEPAVVDAGRAVAKGEIPSLMDPRVHLEFNDARNTLLLDPTRYDIIVAQPSHPWIAGAANVFTHEFFELTQSRLNPGGIYGQWVNLFNMDATTLRILFKTFFDVYPEGLTIGNLYTGDYLLFGSDRPLVFDYQRVQARMDRPEIARAFEHYDVRTAEDVLTYLGLSRREILAVTADSEMNLDTNILSEVRMARLIDVPEGAENPYTFLIDTFKFDAAPYLVPEKAAEQIFNAGLAFIRWEDPNVARHAAYQLESVDATWSRAMSYEVLLNDEKIDEAMALYGKHEKWPDRIHRRQIEQLSARSEVAAARVLLPRIGDDDKRQDVSAYLLFTEGRWAELERLRAATDEQQKWRWLAVARRDIQAAGAQLSKLEPRLKLDIPLLRTLMQYAAAQNNDSQLRFYARRLITATDSETKRLAGLAASALSDHDTRRAEMLVMQIETLNPKAEQLNDLRIKLKREAETVAKNNYFNNDEVPP